SYLQNFIIINYYYYYIVLAYNLYYSLRVDLHNNTPRSRILQIKKPDAPRSICKSTLQELLQLYKGIHLYLELAIVKLISIKNIAHYRRPTRYDVQIKIFIDYMYPLHPVLLCECLSYPHDLLENIEIPMAVL
ncbi:hypothetical protein ACJX0J_024185, partial [Zea mays]